jgi:hypothetical protein
MKFKEKRVASWFTFLSCGSSSVVERQPSKLRVAGSNPVSRSIITFILGFYSIEVMSFIYKISDQIFELSTSDFSYVMLDMCPCSSVGRAHPW